MTVPVSSDPRIDLYEAIQPRATEIILKLSKVTYARDSRIEFLMRITSEYHLLKEYYYPDSSVSQYPHPIMCTQLFSHLLSASLSHETTLGISSTEFRSLAPVTFTLFHTYITSAPNRRINIAHRHRLALLIPTHATSFGYYSMLQLHSFVLPALRDLTSDSSPIPVEYTATQYDFIKCYKHLNPASLRLKTFFQNLDLPPFPEDYDIVNPLSLRTEMSRILEVSRSPGLQAWTSLHSDEIEFMMNDHRYNCFTVNLKSIHDNPLVYASSLDARERHILLRLRFLFLPQAGLDPRNVYLDPSLNENIHPDVEYDDYDDLYSYGIVYPDPD
jgi:hypothetical protein